jgi:hypothetical protein
VKHEAERRGLEQMNVEHWKPLIEGYEGRTIHLNMQGMLHMFG